MPQDKGYNAHDVLGDDKDASGKMSTHTHGLKFTNAGAEGDRMVASKERGLPSSAKGQKTAVNLKGA